MKKLSLVTEKQSKKTMEMQNFTDIYKQKQVDSSAVNDSAVNNPIVSNSVVQNSAVKDPAVSNPAARSSSVKNSDAMTGRSYEKFESEQVEKMSYSSQHSAMDSAVTRTTELLEFAYSTTVRISRQGEQPNQASWVKEKKLPYSQDPERLVVGGYIFDTDSTEQKRLRDARRAEKTKAQIGDEPLEGIDSRYAYRFVKRAFDIVFSAAVLLCFSWLYAILAIIVKVDDPKGPVFFKQERVGKNGKTIYVYKFRSMCTDAESKLEELQALNDKTGPVFKIADDPRITRAGKWLRKLSLDELPQFINTLVGDCSIVGPRPALPKEVKAYTDYQRQRLLVKPGITCYWQTRRNRDAIMFDEWVDLDLLYIKKCGPWTDLKLIIQTVGVVLTAQGS